MALGTATISITAHLIGQSPPQNLTIEGVQDPTTGAATGSVSAASAGVRSLIGANVTISRTGNQDSVTLALPVAQPTDDPAVGQQIWLAKGCGSCHSLGTFDTLAEFPGAPDLAGKGDRLRNDMGTISPVMKGVTLTNQEIIDLGAFLNSF